MTSTLLFRRGRRRLALSLRVVAEILSQDRKRQTSREAEILGQPLRHHRRPRGLHLYRHPTIHPHRHLGRHLRRHRRMHLHRHLGRHLPLHRQGRQEHHVGKRQLWQAWRQGTQSQAQLLAVFLQATPSSREQERN